MATCTSADTRCPPHSHFFEFKGASGYVEEIVARTDAPLLDHLHVTFFNEISFDFPQLLLFISRIPQLQKPETARLRVYDSAIWMDFSFPKQMSGNVPALGLSRIRTRYITSPLVSTFLPDQHFPCTAPRQFCCPPFFPLPTLGCLYIDGWPMRRRDDVENIRWLELLQPFTTMKNLYLSRSLAPPIARSLQELVPRRATKLLLNLQNIFLIEESWGAVHGAFGKFIVRKLSPHRISISHWDI
jgi:hypothetical protein